MEHLEQKKSFRPSLVEGGSKVRASLRGKAFLIPSFVTVAAFFCGFLAVIEAMRGDYLYATKCIALAALFDGLDGRVARRLNATTAFGKEFDSLSDLVSFGVAPAVLVYAWAFQTTAQEFGAIASFTYAVCTAARLARFNLDSGPAPSKSFTGLPSPGAALAIIPLIYYSPSPVTSSFYIGFLSIWLLFIGFLMVSELPYFSLKQIKFTHENSKSSILVISIAVAIAWYSNQLFFLVIGVGYALSGTVSYLSRKFAPWLGFKISKKDHGSVEK